MTVDKWTINTTIRIEDEILLKGKAYYVFDIVLH